MPVISTRGGLSSKAMGLGNRVKTLFTQTFNSNGTFVVPNGTGNVEVLVVAGGGPGGSGFDRTGGAGGGGGLVYNASYTVTPGASIPVVVGAGGIVTGLAAPTTGQNSSFGPLTATGGGYGGASASPLRYLNVLGCIYNRQLTNVSFTNSGTTVTATIPSQLTYTGTSFTFDTNTKMVTCTTSGANAIQVGNRIVVSGTTSSGTAPNGTWIVNYVISSTQFTFHLSTTSEPVGAISNGTVQTDAGHGLSVGQTLVVSGTTASTNPPNNTATDYSTNVLGNFWTISDVPNATQFRFVVTNAPTGSISNGTVGLPETTFVTSYTRAPAIAAAHNYVAGNFFNIIGAPVTGLSNVNCRTNQRFFNGTFNNTRLYNCSFTYSGTTITVTCPEAHGFSLGDPFTVYGTTASSNPPNEASTVSEVVSSTQFRFIASATPTGTITNGDIMGSIITVDTPTPHGIITGGGFASSINIQSTTSFQNPPALQTLISTVPSTTRFTFRVPIAPYNLRFTGSSFSYSGTTITVNTSSAHNLAVNNQVDITGVTASSNPPNGRFYVASVPSATQFTYIASATPTGTLSTGTVIGAIGNSSPAAQNVIAPSYQYFFRVSHQISSVPTPSSFRAILNPASTGRVDAGSMGVPPSNGGSAGAGGHNNSGKNGTITTGIAGQGNSSGDGFDSSFGIFAAGGGGGAGSPGLDGSDFGGGNGGNGLSYFGTLYGAGGGGSVQTLMSSGSFQPVGLSSATYSGSTITINTASAHGLSNGFVVRCSNFSMQNVVVSSSSYSGTTITINTVTPHGLSVGSTIYPFEFTASTNPPNGQFTVASVPSATQFTYVVPNAPTGTLVNGTLRMSGYNHPMGNFVVASVPSATQFTFNNNGLTPIGNGINPGQMYGRFTGVSPTFTYSGTLVTVNNVTNHNLQYAGQSIRVHAVTAGSNAPNGSYRVTRILSPTVFQYSVPAAPTGSLSGGFWESPATWVHYGSFQESSSGAMIPGTNQSGSGAGAVSFPLDGTTTFFNGGNASANQGGGGGAPAYQSPDGNVVSPIGGQGGSGRVVVRYYAWT